MKIFLCSVLLAVALAAPVDVETTVPTTVSTAITPGFEQLPEKNAELLKRANDMGNEILDRVHSFFQKTNELAELMHNLPIDRNVLQKPNRAQKCAFFARGKELKASEGPEGGELFSRIFTGVFSNISETAKKYGFTQEDLIGIFNNFTEGACPEHFSS